MANTSVICFPENKVTKLQFRPFFYFFLLPCGLNLTSLNLVIYILNKMLSIYRVLFTVRILRPCFILKWKSVSFAQMVYRSPLWHLYHTNCFLLSTNLKKQMAHLSSIKMKGGVPSIEVKLFPSFAQCW